MTLPGPDCWYTCPECGKELLQGSWLSGNNFGATYWTDGRETAPMLPSPESATRCSTCGTFFWLADAEVRHEPATSAGWNGPGDRVEQRIWNEDWRPVPHLSQVANANLRKTWLNSRYWPDDVFREGTYEERVKAFRKQQSLTFKLAAALSKDEEALYVPADPNSDEYAQPVKEYEFCDAFEQGYTGGEREKEFRVLAWWRSNKRVYAYANPLPRPDIDDNYVSEGGLDFFPVAMRQWVDQQEAFKEITPRLERLDKHREQNIRRLLELMADDADPNSLLMRAELHRHLGQFEQCVQLAEQVTDEGMHAAKDKIIQLAHAGDTVVSTYQEESLL